ncbi:MAG TPA: NF038122 family metalloprotease, partial [Candidatus Udaeobacter sp.]|nr:NF038122 family metalloprotease [Candidatus Udaeobacter sp.]
MRRGLVISASTLVCVIGGLAGFRGDSKLSAQTDVIHAPLFEPGAGRHEMHARSPVAGQLPTTADVAPNNEVVLLPPPTRSSFMAAWPNVSGAKRYLLDVSTTKSFRTFVDGYHDLDVGGATAKAVTGLRGHTTYYYRVLPYDVTGPTSYSETRCITTEVSTGLVIHATFDSSITGNPNSAAIEATINRAISLYESLFSDPITIEIRFRYSTTQPNGQPLPMGRIAQSDYVYYTISWNTYLDALRADARTGNDATATASLPTSALSTNIRPASAAGRALGFDTPPAMFADGTVGNGGPYDGIVTLNSSALYQFTRPPGESNYDAQRGFEHEMDEVIGLGSYLNISGNDLRPQDLFSWSSAGHRNTGSSGTRYFSVNGGISNIVNFNQESQGDFGDWLSTNCPQAHPYVQNAFACTGQFSDVMAGSPEGINLDVIGYDLVNTPTPTPSPSPSPDPCYPNYTTAEGCNALGSLSTGAGNTALGWQSLFVDTTGSFNTAVGAGALVLNTADS